jgi:hypothetical protein
MLHMGSKLKRTRQTILAWKQYSDENNLCLVRGIHGYDSRFGSDEIFEQFTKDPNIVAAAKASNWWQACQHYNPGLIESTQSAMIEALHKAFEFAEEDMIVVMAGHTPMIEWLAYAFDPYETISRDTKLAELTGFIFTEDNGKIEVTGTVGF